MKMRDCAKEHFDELMKTFKDSGQYDFLEKLTEDELLVIFLLITFLNLYGSYSPQLAADKLSEARADTPQQADDMDLQEKDLHQVNNKDALLINVRTSINDFITELQENAKYHADFIKDNVDLVVFGAEEALKIVEETIEKYENM